MRASQTVRISLLLLLGAAPLAGQSVDKNGREYWLVGYRGGDSHMTNGTGAGSLILTDSTIRLYFKSNKYDSPDLEIPMRAISELSGRSNRVGASLTNWASGDESITIVYDGDHDAEAPVLKTDGGESAQILARIRRRMRKLGVGQ
jgi:hypothetical protein